MKKKLLIIGIVLAITFGGWLTHYFSDKEVIRRQFNTIAQKLSKEGEEAPVMMALKMKQVRDLLAQECRIEIPEQGFSEALEPGMIIRYIINYRTRQQNLLIAVDEITVNIPEKGQAEVDALVHLTANIDQPNFFEETHQVTFSLQKIAKKWLIHRAVLPEDLTRY